MHSVWVTPELHTLEIPGSHAHGWALNFLNSIKMQSIVSKNLIIQYLFLCI
jgi:hypothetical protein